jgi:cytochrome c553
MKRTRIALAAAALLLASAVQAHGGDPEKGKAKAAQVCAACHSADGTKPSAPDQPILAGQYYDYLVQALGDYKSGKRKNAIMMGFAAALSQQDIEDLAAWFSSRPSRLHFER